MAFDEQLATRIREQIGKRRGLAEKKIFGGLAFLLNGNMACGIHRNELMVRIDPGETDSTLKQRHTHVFDLTGRPMKGWILVRPPGFARADALKKWVQMGVKYAASLPPK